MLSFDEDWYIDSSASHHITMNRSLLSNYRYGMNGGVVVKTFNDEGHAIVGTRDMKHTNSHICGIYKLIPRLGINFLFVY